MNKATEYEERRELNAVGELALGAAVMSGTKGSGNCVL